MDTNYANDCMLLAGYQSDLSVKIKEDFFQAVAVSILLYGSTTWTVTKQMVKKLDGNYTRILHIVLNISWKQRESLWHNG